MDAGAQPDLFRPVVHVDGGRGLSLQEAFERFHEANPHVYQMIVRLARQARAAGRRRVGIGMLFEVLRWNYTVLTAGSDFKLNNSFRSRYVRLIERREADLREFFETRDLRS
jgi:hypothetical protein